MPNLIYCDWETLPDMREGAKEKCAESVSPPGNMKKEDTIAKWWENEGNAAKEKAWRDTALDPTSGTICCLGYAINDEKPKSIVHTNTNSEVDIINEFFDTLTEEHADKAYNSTLVGHYLSTFDHLFLWRRCYILGIKPPNWYPGMWEENRLKDTRQMWCGKYNRQDHIGLERLCEALGIESPKQDLSGGKVLDAWLAGEYERIGEYCANGDIVATRSVYRKLTFQEV